jgi:ribosomal protein S18 acetylase RimI-like enzyme
VTAIAGLVERAYGSYIDQIGVRPGPLDDDYAERVREGNAFVAVEGEAITGLIVLIQHPDHLLVENVAVDPDRQREGIGRALLAFAEDIARCAGLTELRLYTHALMARNRALYVGLGYEELDRRDEEGFDRVFFAKHLQ